MGGEIYVPPGSRGNPFVARSGGRRWGVSVLIGAVVVLLLGIVGAMWAAGDGDGADARPGPLVAGLLATDWRWPADPESGYRRLSTPFRKGTSFDRVAANEAGVVAVAMRPPEGGPSVLVWRAGAWQAHAFPGQEAVTALGVTPEGSVHVGFSGGLLARIGAAGEVVEEGVISSGYSVVGFAFDRDSDRSALMLSGGEVRTGRRPLRRASLHTVTMPPRARIRHLIYSKDGDLVVAGDAGALFVATDDGWAERSLPTAGHVSALGLDADGDLLVAQSNGHVFTGSGVTWSRVGQINGNPVAVGWSPGRGVLVTAASGRMYATLGRDDFSEVPGWQPPPEVVADHGVVAGHNVLLAARDRLLVFDGASFDSAGAADPEGTVGAEGCTPVGTGFEARPGAPTVLFDCGRGRHALLEGGVLSDVELVQVGGRPVPAVDYVRALAEGARRGAVWAGPELWGASPRGHLPGLERWSFDAERWEPVAPLAPEAGDVLSISAAPAADGQDLWAVTRSGTVYRALVAPGAERVELEPKADHAAFQALWSASEACGAAAAEDGSEGAGAPADPACAGHWLAHALEVHALGAGEALVLHDGWRASRVVADGSAPVALALLEGPPTFRMRIVPADEGVLVVEQERLRRLRAGEAPVELRVPAGVDLSLPSFEGDTWSAASRGDDLILRGAGALLLRCHGLACAPLPLPPWVAPRGVLLGPNGTVVVLERAGLLGVIPREEAR